MMAQYEADQRAADQDTMLNAAKMNAKWGGSFKHGVGSNTWKNTPWAKYDDAVKPRKIQMLAQMPSKALEEAADRSMEAYDSKHPSPEVALAKLDKMEDEQVEKRMKAGGNTVCIRAHVHRKNRCISPC